MQNSQDGIRKQRVQLKSSVDDFRVEGFSNAYTAYRKAIAGDSAYTGWLLTIFGAGILLLGIATIIVGPKVIYYSRLSGPTLAEYIQLYPGPIATVGGLILTLGTTLRSRPVITPEAYLHDHYLIVSISGQDFGEQVAFQYLQGDEFRIVPIGKPAAE